MIDRHIHLSGATSTALLWELIVQSGYKTSAKSYWEFRDAALMNRANVKSLDEYLAILHRLELAQSSPQAVEACFYDAFRSSFLAGTTVMEMRWNPVKRSQKGAIDLDRLIVAARSGYERAMSTFGIQGSMIFCLGRDLSTPENEAVWKMAQRYFGKGCQGVDVAGPENRTLMEMTELPGIFDRARELKMERTIHCAETPGENNEAELEHVLTVLRPNRIGHGIQIHKFPELMKLAAREGTHFEVCISSNLATNAVSTLEDFKTIFANFEAYGISYSINTDSTELLQTTLARELSLYESLKGS